MNFILKALLTCFIAASCVRTEPQPSIYNTDGVITVEYDTCDITAQFTPTPAAKVNKKPAARWYLGGTSMDLLVFDSTGFGDFTISYDTTRIVKFSNTPEWVRDMPADTNNIIHPKRWVKDEIMLEARMSGWPRILNLESGQQKVTIYVDTSGDTYSKRVGEEYHFFITTNDLVKGQRRFVNGSRSLDINDTAPIYAPYSYIIRLNGNWVTALPEQFFVDDRPIAGYNMTHYLLIHDFFKQFE